jgi:glycosyltransferase involved in cell wall biosynthesis
MHPGGPRVVIVHDYVTQRGGAERVTLDLLKAFPGARLVTSFWHEQGSFPEFREHEIETLWTNRLRPLRRDPRKAFPLLAGAFARHTVTDADLVICSSSGWSHRVRTTGMKVVYCHNPARWLYQPEEYFGSMSSRGLRVHRWATKRWRASDLRAALTADHYLVNSTAVAGRVEERYGIKARIVPPARGLATDGPLEPVPGVEPGFLLTIARDRGYKNTEAVYDAVSSMGNERLIVVGGSGEPQASNIQKLDGLTDAQMRWLYSNASGLVAVAFEDFGLTAVEAQAFGLPSVLLRHGGYLDTGVEGLTALFVDEATPEAISAGIYELRATAWDQEAIRRIGHLYSPEAFADRIRVTVDQLLSRGRERTVTAGGRTSRLVSPYVEDEDDTAVELAEQIGA